MLKQEDLTAALHDGLKASERCSNTFCRASATIENEGYLIAHNGMGSRDTDVQRVHDTKALGLSREQLAERIKTWISGVHTGVKIDLNASTLAVDRGPALLGWPWRAVDHFGRVVQGA